ncbi:MAG TPA: disulfide oxidoreductase, partial [Vicinamibacteria bacterium]
NRALRAGVRERVQAFADEDDNAFALATSGQILWRGAAVARLLPGERLLDPQVDPLATDLLDPPLREKVRRRLAEWLKRHLEGTLGPLLRLRDGAAKGAPRGLAFALAEGLGSVPRRRVAAQVAALRSVERAELSRRGVILGRQAVFLPELLKPGPLRLRRVLWSIGHGPAPEPDGRPAVDLDPSHPAAAYEACGYQAMAGMAVRVDVLHRIAVNLARLSDRGPFGLPPELEVMLGQGREAAAHLLLGELGYVRRGDLFVSRRRERPAASERRRA